MAKFHINSNGDVKPCKAAKVACQFGDSSLHFENEAAARAVAESALEAAAGDTNALRGKKSNLNELMGKKLSFDERLSALKTNHTTPKTPAKKPRDEAVDRIVAKEVTNGFSSMPIEKLPNDVARMFNKGMRPGEKAVKAFTGEREYYKLLVRTRDDRLIVYTTPNIKDVPHLTTEWKTWSMALHPQGPKVTFRCARCRRENAKRLGQFEVKKQGDFQTRCSCGQINMLQIRVD